MIRANLLLASGVFLFVPSCSYVKERHLQSLFNEKVASVRANDLMYSASKEPLVQTALKKYPNPKTELQVSHALYAVTDAIGDRHVTYYDPAITPFEFLTGDDNFGLAFEDRFVVGFEEPLAKNANSVQRGDRLEKVAGIPAEDTARVNAELSGGVGKTFVLTFSRGSRFFSLPFTYHYAKDYAATDVHRVMQHAVYVNVPTENLTQEDAPKFIPPIFDRINALADADACGLVLDLRMNEGGLAVIGVDLAGRLFGEGDQISFSYLDAPAVRSYWTFQRGNGVYIHTPHSSRSHAVNWGASSSLNIVDPWIAVLIGPQTASAAEMMAIASKKNARSVLIGEHTAGVTTTLIPQTFSDDSMLWMSNSFFSDLKGHTYKDGVNPDIAAVTHWKDYLGVEDLPLKAAQHWLQSKGCH
jgi:C-terminal processing protease CtpA/Prc